MLQYLKNLVTMRRDRNEAGASAVEYGLLIAGIAAVIAAVVFAFSGTITGLFDDTCNEVGGTNCVVPGAPAST